MIFLKMKENQQFMNERHRKFVFLNGERRKSSFDCSAEMTEFRQRFTAGAKWSIFDLKSPYKGPQIQKMLALAS